jgi:glycosyltransferase involved in cell wall biosynthesis
MSIWVYTVVRNEALLIRYWLRHYQSFCSRVIVYDDASDDGTREMVQASGAELRDCPWSGLDDMLAAAFASQQYREARGQADWVIWVDGDEFIYHPAIESHLAHMQALGVTLPQVAGYSMFADQPPAGDGQIYGEVRNGIPDERYCKPVVLDPYIDMQWGPGKHEFAANGVRDAGTSVQLKLLHYRWFGENAYLQRNARNLSKLSQSNRDYGLGIEVFSPTYTGHHSFEWYRQMQRVAPVCV